MDTLWTVPRLYFYCTSTYTGMKKDIVIILFRQSFHFQLSMHKFPHMIPK